MPPISSGRGIPGMFLCSTGTLRLEFKRTRRTWWEHSCSLTAYSTLHLTTTNIDQFRHQTPLKMHSAICLLVLAVVVAAALAAPAPQDNQPKLTVEASHTRHGGGQGPSGHTESFKVTQDAWVSKNGNWRAGGYVQHDREKFGGFSNRNTHGGLSVTGRF